MATLSTDSGIPQVRTTDRVVTTNQNDEFKGNSRKQESYNQGFLLF